MASDIKTLLEELYALEPSLQSHEKEIVSIIKSMMKNAPKVDIDESFRAELRAKIESEIGLQTKSSWSWAWPTLSGVLACALFGVFFWNASTAPSTAPSTALISFQPEIKQVKANAFAVTNGNNRPQSGGGGMGGAQREMAMSNVAPTAAVAVSDAPVNALDTANNPAVTTTDAVVSKMIAPDSMIYPPMDFPVFNYVYDGEIQLPTQAQIVYKKTVVPFSASSTRGILSALNIDSIDIGAMTNLGVTNISLTEDTEYGYMTNIDFASGNISIYQNYLKWPQPVCDMNGCNQKTLTESDIPSDATVRNAADAFLKKFSIDTSLYGEPIVDSSWKIWYARSSSVGGMTQTVPEMYTITYPFMLDGQIVYEEGGMARGLSLNYDVRTGRITSFYGLEKQSLESSEYPAIADMDLVKKMIKQGTRYISDTQPVIPNQKIVDVALGEPKIVYLHVYGEWKNGRSDEFLVPALMFPVTGKPDLENTYSYTPTTITIPLVADFVQKVDYSTPVPMPLVDPAVMDAAVSSEAPAKEPAVKQ